MKEGGKKETKKTTQVLIEIDCFCLFYNVLLWIEDIYLNVIMTRSRIKESWLIGWLVGFYGISTLVG